MILSYVLIGLKESHDQTVHHVILFSLNLFIVTETNDDFIVKHRTVRHR